MLVGGLVPAATVAAGAAGLTAAAVATAPAAHASTLGSVLILSSSVNGGSSSAEAQAVSADDYTPVIEPASAWDAEVVSGNPAESEDNFASLFSSYAAVIIGDPSSGGACSSVPDADAAGSAAYWGPEISGNVAVLGAAPALAGSAGTALMQDAIAYAAAGYNSSSSSGTGLYVSLNCDYASSSDSDVAASLLSGVYGGGFDVTGQVPGSGPSCSDSGTVNQWEADDSGSFASLASSALTASSWGPACPVQETFDSWPGNFTAVAYDAAAAPADFTASDGQTGQPYVLLGTPAASPATLAEAPATGGDVAPLTEAGGSNAASHASQATAGDPVNTENGDFSQSATDVSVPVYGPSLEFTRTYDAQVAQQEEETGTPGPLGYGWTDNYASTVSTGAPVPGDIYALDGLAGASGTGDDLTAYAQNGQSPASAPLGYPGGVLVNSGNIYWSDTGGNRVQEIPAASGSQWGISMTAGETYTIAGSYTGQQGTPTYGGPATSALLSGPTGLAMDSAGNLYIADSGNDRIEEVSASGTIAQFAGSTAGVSGDGGAATSAHLDDPVAVAFDSAGDAYIADAGNNRIQEVFATGGQQWGQSMTAGDIYTVAGSAAGSPGRSGNGTAGGSSYLDDPRGIAVDGSGDLLIADTGNNRIAEIPRSAGSQWGISSMTAGDVYDIAGSASGTAGHSGDGSSARSTALLDAPGGVSLDSAGNLVIADTGNNRVQFVPKSSGTNWDQSMTADDMYTMAGSSAGTAGNSGNGGAGTAALLDGPASAATFSSGKLWIADTINSQIRDVSDSSYDIALDAGDGQTLASAGDGGPAINGDLVRPGGELTDAQGDLIIADTGNNRIQEIAASTHTQWGSSTQLQGGDVYTIAGSATGQAGDSGSGTVATSALLDAPEGLALDASGNLLITDQDNNVVRVLAASTGTFYGQPMTAGDLYTIAGTGTAGTTGDGDPATRAELDQPFGIAVDSRGDIYLADTGSNRIQEIYEGGQDWGNTGWTAGDSYTIAGSSSGAEGDSGDGGAATAAKLNGPEGIATDTAGDVYLTDTGNNQVREIPAQHSSNHWGQPMTAGDIYTVAGSTSGTAGSTGTGGPATASQLHTPVGLATDSTGDVYIADGANDRIQEIAAAPGVQFATQMSTGDIYTIAGKPGTASDTGNGGPASMATVYFALSNSTDSYGDLYIGDWSSGQLREIPSDSPDTIQPAAGVAYPSALYPPPGSTINGTTYPQGITITQPGGAPVTFYPQSSTGTCTLPQVQAGQYCVDSSSGGASLTATNSDGTIISYTFSPSPDSDDYTYSATTGQLTAETDPAGDTLTISYGTVGGNDTPVGAACPTSAYSCDTIISASGDTNPADGRYLIIGLTSTGKVVNVTDPMGREWEYGYVYPGTDLTSVTDPMFRRTSYSYDINNPDPLLQADLLTITGPNAQNGGPDVGDDTVNTYNAQGQVTAQTDPMGNTTTFTYCADAADYDCLNPATGDGYVTVTDPDNNTTVYGYQAGTLVSQDNLTNGSSTVTSQTNNLPDTSSATTSGDCPGDTDGSLLDAASFDGDNNQTTSCYDTAGDITSSTSPSGGSTASGTETTTSAFTPLTSSNSGDESNCSSDAQATSLCAPNSGPQTVTAGTSANLLAITPPSSAPPSGQTLSLYDSNGNQLYTTTGVYSPTGTYRYSQTTYQLYGNDSVTLPGTETPITCASTPPSPSLACATINPDGVVTQLAYDTQGDLVSTSTPDGNSGGQLATTTDTYDADGEQTAEVAPDGNVSGASTATTDDYTTVTAYDADGEETSVTQAGGTAGSGPNVTPRTTSYGYDADGNQTTVTDARGYTTTTTYNADDEATLVTNPDNDMSLTCYDGDGNTAQTVPPVGVAANSLTPASCPTSYPSGYTDRLASDATTSTYDADGNLTATTTPAPAGQSGEETTTYTYDGDGNKLTITAPPTTNGGSSQATVETYNSADELAAETTGSGTPAASTVSYCYDPNGDQTSVAYADGNTSGVATCETSYPWVISSSAYPTQAAYQTTSAYDSVGEEVSTTTPATAADPSGGTTTYTYDPAGHQVTSTDPAGVTTTSTYGTDGYVITVAYSGSAAHTVTYGYDANGQMDYMTDATGATNLGFDSFGELTSAENGADQTVTYGYNADGQVTGITYPLPSTASWATTHTVSYAYDNADQLSSVTDFNANKIAIGDTADGLPASLALGSTGDTITTTYDQANNPSAITLANSGGTLQSFNYTYSQSGNILTEADGPGSQSPASYTYDADSRVTAMTAAGSNSPSAYSFDPSGNLTGMPGGAAGTYDKAGELTSSVISGTTTAYTYNADGQRVSSKQGSSTITSATWNGAGQLTAYSTPTVTMTGATYSGDGLRESSTSTAGSPATQAYVWDNNAQAPALLMDSANAYIYATSNTPAEQVNLASGTITYLSADSLGSVRGTISATGALTGTSSYDAWGNPAAPGGLTATTPFGFAGGYTDPDGLLYLINRYYDPATGQFLSADPDVSQTLQPYAYANGNPIGVSDPMGLSAADWKVIGNSCEKGYVRWCDMNLNITIASTSPPFEETDSETVRFSVHPHWKSASITWYVAQAWSPHQNLSDFVATVYPMTDFGNTHNGPTVIDSFPHPVGSKFGQQGSYTVQYLDDGSAYIARGESYGFWYIIPS